MVSSVSHPLISNDFYGALLARAEAVEQHYRSLTPKSARLFARTGGVFPGGYTRDAIMRRPYPSFVVEGEGDILTDVDGRRIIDLWFNATSLPVGHAHPAVTEAVGRQLSRGTAYYAPTENELALAELLLERLPSAERVRFTNSGSEAVMMALRFARAATGRSVILKFEGSYHGSYDDVSWSVNPALARAGSVEAPNAVAETSGLAGADGRLLIVPFNNVQALREAVEAHHADLACIVVEPMANRMGLVTPDRAFLEEARKLCDRFGIVLVFDEVICFRVAYHGKQGEVGIAPDLTALGKIIGGGFPVGAVVGRASILDLSHPDLPSRVSHAGTFNGNPMTSVAGLATMQLLDREAFAEINARGADIRKRLAAICEGLPLQVSGEGSLFKVTAVDHPVRNYRDAALANKRWETAASLALLSEGFLLTTSMAGCVSTVTPQAHIDAFLDAFAAVVAS